MRIDQRRTNDLLEKVHETQQPRRAAERDRGQACPDREAHWACEGMSNLKTRYQRGHRDGNRQVAA